MKSALFAVFLSPFLLSSIESPSDIMAQTYKPAPCSTPQKKQPCEKDHRVQIGGNYTYAWITPDGNATTTGSLGGAQGLYEYRPLDSVYAGVAFHYRIGNTSNTIGSRELQDFNPQARVGYTLSSRNVFGHFTLFTGFGARYMAETVSIGTASLDFDYTHFYVPVGFLVERQITKNFLIGCNFQWMPQVLPMVRIDLLNGAQWDLTYQLGNFFVEFPFIFSTCEGRYTFSINPFLETWRDGHTTAETLTHLTLSLPGNDYIFTGVNVNFGFCF